MTLLPQIQELMELRHRANVLGISTHHKVNSVLSGLYVSVFRGQGMDFEENREYQEGDEIRNMDWRVTARTGVPHMKVFREERERAVILCVDVGAHMQFGTRGTFKSVQAAKAAALMGWSASTNQDRVGAMLFGDPAQGPRFFRPSRARRSFWRMLQALSEDRRTGLPVEGDAMLEALDRLHRVAPTGALLFIVGDLNRDPASLQPILGKLRQRHELILMPVDDIADREIPNIGRVVFQAQDGRRIEVETDSDEGRRLYREMWERYREDLETLCSRLALTLIPLSTDADIHQVLVNGLRRRMRREVTR